MIGFFIIINHNVSEQLRSEILNETRRMFYALSGREKDDISINDINSYRGYQEIGLNVTNGLQDGHEALDIMSESIKADRRRWDNNNNKNNNYDGEPTNYGINHYGINQWPSVKKLSNFRPCCERYVMEMNRVGNKLIYGYGERTDYGVFTVILCDDCPGMLQIRSKKETKSSKNNNNEDRDSDGD
jgi:isopenicillin N synthase-like dioxygenase